MPSLPIGGVVTGTATMNGSTDGELRIVADIDHRDRGTRSAARRHRRPFISPAERRSTSTSRAHPVSLVEVGRFFPAAGLQGSVVGTDSHLGDGERSARATPTSGCPTADASPPHGTLDVASREKGYDLVAPLVRGQSAARS